jgi:formylglycine-generating enzyme required for sulfatase activity
LFVCASARAAPTAGFSVTTATAVPQARAPEALSAGIPGGADFRSLDVEALKTYDDAAKRDRSDDASPEDKAASWRRLARDAPAFADTALKRAAEWDRYAAERKAAEAAARRPIESRDADWKKLGQLLALNVVPEAEKARWCAEFLKAYWKSPGVEPEMAGALAAHLAPGPTRDALRALALKAAQDAAAAPAPPPGKAGIEWVRIPGGTFTMGSPDYSDAQPHRVTIKTFYMAKTLTTNKQYQACVAAGACTPSSHSFEGDDKPVVKVDWQQAKTFAAWAGGRLPSEAEWEYAARSAGKDRKYPWGDSTPTCDDAVIGGCGYEGTAPVCSKPAGNTEQGLCDMAGNAWEWMEDYGHLSYIGAPTDGSAWIEGGANRMIRGSSWADDAFSRLSRTTLRRLDVPEHRGGGLGFRLAH